MSLPNLLNVPTDQAGFNFFSQNDDDLHQRIIDEIQNQHNITLTRYILNPIPSFDLQSWLRREQQAHNDMNAVFGFQGVDLTDVDFQKKEEVNSWIQLHFSEMQQIASELGIG